MNLAFNSILIILLLLPGFIFTLALYNSDEPFHYTPLTHRTIISMFMTILLLWAGTYLFLKISPYEINYSALLEIIAGKNNDQYLQSITSTNLICFGVYIITLYIFAYFIGFLLNLIVRIFKLDA